MLGNLAEPGAVMSDTVVPFRSRDQVARRIRSFRSDPPPPLHRVRASAPMRIEGSVVLTRLLRGLASAGLVFRHDARTGEYVIMPDPDVPS